MKDQLPAAGCGINLLGETLKADILVIQLGNAFNEVFEGAAKPIKPPDNERVPIPDVAECLGQAFALCLCAADGIREDFQAAGRIECVLLEVEVLFLR